MPVQVLPATSRDGKRLDAVFDSSFEAVCLFSALGIIFSLIFLLVVEPAFDVGVTPTSIIVR